MTTFWLSVGLAVWLAVSCGALHGAGIDVGMTRAEVEAALGRPKSVLQRGEVLVLVFAKNGRVELENGKVVHMSGVPMQARDAAPTASGTAEAQAGIAEGAAAENERGAIEGFTPKADIVSKRPVHIDPEQLSMPDDEAMSPAEDVVPGLVVLLIIGLARTAVMVVVLKLAFAWADVHADWGQMILPSVADTLTRGVVAAVGYYGLGAVELFYVDEAIAYFALLLVLRKTTHACTLVRAVSVAGAAKFVGMLLGMLITVIVLNLLG